jgi:hypothetical protein
LLAESFKLAARGDSRVHQLDLVENPKAVAIEKAEVDRPTRAPSAETAIERTRKEHVNRADKYQFVLRLENP